MPKPPPADDDTPGSERDHARTTIRKLLALSELGVSAESVTPQDVVGAVAELLAAAAQVGAIPTCSVSANVHGKAVVVTVSAWEGDVTGMTIALATATDG